MELIVLDGYRCRIFFENINRMTIPKEYHYSLRNQILLKINETDSQLSNEIHDRWDAFLVYSGIMGKMWNTPLGLQFRNAEVDVASPNKKLISYIIRGFLMSPIFNLGQCRLRVSSVQSEHIDLKEGKSTLNLETLGEVVIKKKDRNSETLHVGEDDNIEEYLRDIIFRQYYAFSGVQSEFDLNVTYSKQKKKAIIKDDGRINSFKALRLKFTLNAEKELHEFLLTQGIGHHRKMGFGMIGLQRAK